MESTGITTKNQVGELESVHAGPASELTKIVLNNQSQAKGAAPTRSASAPEISNSDSNAVLNELKSLSLCDLTDDKQEEHDLKSKAASEAAENARRVQEADSTLNQEGLVPEINEEKAREENLQVIHIVELDSISVQEDLEMEADKPAIPEENKLLEESPSDFFTDQIVQKPNCALKEADVPMEMDCLSMVEAQDSLEPYVENAYINENSGVVITNISAEADFSASSSYVISPAPILDPLADAKISVEVDIRDSSSGISQASKYMDPLADVEKMPPNSVSAGFDTTSTSTYYDSVSADEVRQASVQANDEDNLTVVKLYGQHMFDSNLADQTDEYMTQGLHSVEGSSEGLFITCDLDQTSSKKKTIRLRDPKYLFDNTTLQETVVKVNFQSSDDTFEFVRKCEKCEQAIVTNQNCLSWGTNEFCNGVCLFKYQKRLGSNCVKCGAHVRPACLGKFCVRFGCNMQQFCGSICLREYKQCLQLCCYCQSNLAEASRIVVKLQNNGNFKEFCAGCQNKYKSCQNPSICSICLMVKLITIEFEHNGEMRGFCSETCFGTFKYVNKITSDKCKMCQKFYDIRIVAQNTIFYENSLHHFCSKSCQNVFIIANRKIVLCTWCKAKKYTFDMIRCHQSQSPVLMVCSLSCLNLYQISITAFNCNMVNCDYCHENMQQPLYNLTMSDGTIRHFCSYSCVTTLQQQFPTEAMTLNEHEITLSVPVGPPKVLQTASGGNDQDVVMLEVVSPLRSPLQNNLLLAPTAFVKKKTSNAASTTASKQQLVVKQPPMAPQKNKSTMCKLVTHDKGVNMKPDTLDKSVQTNAVLPKIIPIPVPIYVPAPMWMYSMPYPVPFPFPLPIPVPVFIPTTRNHYTEIMRDIQEKPANPIEAEILVMAKMIADDVGEATANPKEDRGLAEVDKEIGKDVSKDGMPSVWAIDDFDMEETLVTSFSDGSPEKGEECDAIVTTGVKRSQGHANESAKKRLCEKVDDSHSSPDANMCLKFMYSVNCWKRWIEFRNSEFADSIPPASPFKAELLDLSPYELNKLLCVFIAEVKNPNGESYTPDIIYYLCLGIQLYLNLNQRIDNLFCDFYYEAFTERLDEIVQVFSDTYNNSNYVITRVEEEHLWESKQLGVDSPQVLLNTLIFFNTKYFNLKTIADHMNLAFSNVMKHWGSKKGSASRTKGVLLRLYADQCVVDQSGKRKNYEQLENVDNPLRCPVQLYEFYLSKCPESVKYRTDVFYLQPERYCVADSPVWFSTTPLSENVIGKTLNRVKMVKEINVAFLNNT